MISILLFYSVFHTDQDDPSSSDDEGMPYTRPVKFKAAHGFKGPYDFDQIKVVQDLSGEHMVRNVYIFHDSVFIERSTLASIKAISCYICNFSKLTQEE